MKWKICGMRSPENIRAVAALQPDYMGFIFWEHSQRYVSEPTPKTLGNIKKTGVFVDASKSTISAISKKHQLDALQLHGTESPEFCEQLQSLNLEIIKAFSIKDTFDFGQLAVYEDVCDYFLFDTKGKLPGGNGYTFDWSLLTDYPSKKPFFLSGGIGVQEITALKKILKLDLPLYCIDVNSKFETQAAIKDTEQIKKFITALFKEEQQP